MRDRCARKEGGVTDQRYTWMGVFVKILPKKSRKEPTDKKDGGLFLTHRRTMKTRNHKGDRGWGGELRDRRREGNDHESWRGLGGRSDDQARRTGDSAVLCWQVQGEARWEIGQAAE